MGSLYLALSNPLTEPLYELLKWLNGIASGLPLPSSISSWAVAIILVAVVIKLATYPLTATQMKSMRSMQAVQPKLKEIQKRYKDDREKLAQAQMELYREPGVNPFGGCLPLVVQMVVLLGLYGAINRLVGEHILDGQGFLWVPNLGACEPNPLCAEAGSGIPILLILLVLSQFAYQKYATPPSADSQSQAMNQSMKFMPLFFAFIFAKLAAGLVLYYAAFNIVSVAQQAWIVRGSAPGAPSSSFAASDDSVAEVLDDGSSNEQEEQKPDEGAIRRRRRRKKSR